MASRITLALLCLTIAISIPLFYELSIEWLVASTGTGWVFSSIFLRVIVILLFAIALYQVFQLSSKLAKIKRWLVFLIAIPPGFGISFIAPIYVTDYGMLGDSFELTGIPQLEIASGEKVRTEEGPTLIAFFTTTCPFCKSASRKLGINLDGGQTVPVTAIFPGNESDTEKFIQKYHGEKFNTLRIANDSLFVAASGGIFPSLFLVDGEGNTIHHWVGDELNYTGLDYLKSFEQ